MQVWAVAARLIEYNVRDLRICLLLPNDEVKVLVVKVFINGLLEGKSCVFSSICIIIPSTATQLLISLKDGASRDEIHFGKPNRLAIVWLCLAIHHQLGLVAYLGKSIT